MRKIHFIGICGAGMSATAKIMKDLNWQVTGSDENFYHPVSTYLKESRIMFFKDYKKENIPSDVDIIVIGKHNRLISESNEEVKYALNSGVPIKSFAEILGEVTKYRKNIVVAGSYGKSTCTALTVWCLERAGKDPGYFIGAIPETPPSSSNVGSGGYFILEGDEYPSSNWDEKSKFFHYHPEHILLTSLAHDHLNVFKTVNDYRRPFIKLIRSMPANGLIVACADGDGVVKTLGKFGRRVEFYGLKNKASWQVKNIKFGETTSFEIFRGRKPIIKIKTGLIGLHNIENILGVGTLLLSLKLISAHDFALGVKEFKPLQRRLDKKSYKTTIPIYEGFGSSYDKAKSALAAMKLHFQDRKIIVMFEPHTFSWQSRQALSWYKDVFKGADHVYLYKPPDFKKSSGQLSLKEIKDKVLASGINVSMFRLPEDLLDSFASEIDKDTAVLILSSGGFDGIIENAVKISERKFPKK